jgi:hypothetical protein
MLLTDKQRVSENKFLGRVVSRYGRVGLQLMIVFQSLASVPF